MKEFPSGPNNKWTRIFKKKWFFPALYIVLAVFILSAVVWYQNVQSKMFSNLDGKDATEQNDGLHSDSMDDKGETESVVRQEESIKMPVSEEASTEIVTTFYDYTAEEDEQEKGLTFYNNRYYQSTGVDIAQNDGEAFEVTASLSGTVEEIKQDPLYGNVVVLDHGDEIATYYTSLDEFSVKEGDKIKQGDTLGTAGNSLFGEENGTHVHFEISKDGVAVNPEDFFNQTLNALKETNVDEGSESELMKDEEQTDVDEEDVDDTQKDEDQEDTSEEDEEASKDLSISLPV